MSVGPFSQSKIGTWPSRVRVILVAFDYGGHYFVLGNDPWTPQADVIMKVRLVNGFLYNPI